MFQQNNVVRYILLVVIGMVVVGIFGYLRSGNFAGPQIDATPSSYDFGRIDPEPASKSFELRNTGNSVLKISRLSTFCSCTTAEVTEKEISPGGSATLTVNFDPTAMDPPIRGEVKRIVYIETNDPDHEETKIKITANVSGGEQAENQ